MTVKQDEHAEQMEPRTPQILEKLGIGWVGQTPTRIFFPG